MTGGTGAYAELLRTEGPCALFESTCGPGPLAELSILARAPRALLVAEPGRVRVASGAGVQVTNADPFAIIREWLAALPPGRWPEEGAVAGVLSYDAARPAGAPPGTPLLVAMAVDRLSVFAGPRLLARGVQSAGPDVDGMLWPIRGPRDRDDPTPALPLRLGELSNMTRDEHARLVARVQEHIGRGDIYQANLSQRFALPFPRRGLDLYHPLRQVSPAPFAGYFRAGPLEVVSASPERLLLVDEGRAVTRPIAGTRPRSPDPERDRALARELILSEKERAEHLMLVDLARNDLGRVAAIGSVAVDELMIVEEYAQVRHIVSNVRARLAPGRDPLDALLALFPGGTITGVPKLRCMDILEALEPGRRGFYTGALFYVTPSGRLDANILIRSAVVQEGRVSFSAGGGIVADSVAAAEYEETLHKAEGMRLAIEAALA